MNCALLYIGALMWQLITFSWLIYNIHHIYFIQGTVFPLGDVLLFYILYIFRKKIQGMIMC